MKLKKKYMNINIEFNQIEIKFIIVGSVHIGLVKHTHKHTYKYNKYLRNRNK